MITYIDKTNEDLVKQYTKLFDDAETALGVPIDDLPTYFEHLNSLARLAPKYVRIPLDEEMFVIDADKRTINVPKTFANNGISVKNDEVAEIVYFKINRFFDIADLSKKKIIIAWQDATGKQGITAAFMQDNVVDENGEDFLVFGWPLDTRITSAAGTIKFAVRFYTIGDDDKINYSLSTMAASARILTTLEVDLESVEIKDLKDFVLDRLTDRESFVAPKILTNLPDHAALNTEGKLELVIECEDLPDGSDIQQTYKWFKDGVMIPDEIGTSYIATNIGSYQVEITNTIQVPDSYDAAGNLLEYHTESRRIKSVICEIPEAADVEIVEDLIDKAYFDANGIATVTMKIAKPNGQLSVKALRKNKSNDEYSEVTEKITDDEGHDIFMAEATYAEPNELDTDVLVTLKVNKAVVDAKANGSRYENFKVRIINSLNNDDKSIDSEPCRITEVAAKPVLSLTYGNAVADGSQLFELGEQFVVSVADLHSDALSYQWYLFDSKTAGDDPIVGAIEPEYLPTNPGKYYVQVINTLNGSVSEPSESAAVQLYEKA